MRDLSRLAQDTRNKVARFRAAGGGPAGGGA